MNNMDMNTPIPTSTRRKPRLNFRILLFAALVLFLAGAPIYIYLDSVLTGGIKQRGDLLEVDLKAISDFPFDQANGTLDDIPAQFRALNGKRVLVYGEMWEPRSADNRVATFDLVYSIARCCFNGPPQIQHFVKAQVTGDRRVGYYQGLVKVVGTLKVDVKRDGGKVTQVYELDVEQVEPVA